MPSKIINRTRERQKAAHENAEKEYRKALYKERIAQLKEDACLRAQQAIFAEVEWGMDIYQQAVTDQEMRVETWTARTKRYIAKLASLV